MQELAGACRSDETILIVAGASSKARLFYDQRALRESRSIGNGPVLPAYEPKSHGLVEAPRPWHPLFGAAWDIKADFGDRRPKPWYPKFGAARNINSDYADRNPKARARRWQSALIQLIQKLRLPLNGSTQRSNRDFSTTTIEGDDYRVDRGGDHCWHPRCDFRSSVLMGIRWIHSVVGAGLCLRCCSEGANQRCSGHGVPVSSRERSRNTHGCSGSLHPGSHGRIAGRILEAHQLRGFGHR